MQGLDLQWCPVSFLQNSTSRAFKTCNASAGATPRLENDAMPTAPPKKGRIWRGAHVVQLIDVLTSDHLAGWQAGRLHGPKSPIGDTGDLFLGISASTTSVASCSPCMLIPDEQTPMYHSGGLRFVGIAFLQQDPLIGNCDFASSDEAISGSTASPFFLAGLGPALLVNLRRVSGSIPLEARSVESARIPASKPRSLTNTRWDTAGDLSCRPCFHLGAIILWLLAQNGQRWQGGIPNWMGD